MRAKILVIDDEELLTKTFVRLLEKSGYEVFVAKRGEDALEMAEEMDFDLVLCDIRMPGMDGIETVKKLRDLFQKRKLKLPEIFITGYADTESEKRAKALGPVAYLEKPFDNTQLLNKIAAAIKPGV